MLASRAAECVGVAHGVSPPGKRNDESRFLAESRN